jgi:hypothetical protein
MTKIIPPQRPRRDKADIAAILDRHELSDQERAHLVFIRGYYLDSMGAKGVNDLNAYDDAAFLVSPRLYESFNANTDPSFVSKSGRNLAMLNLGKYQFYKGKHKGQYPALRTYPEGRVLPCTRAGVPATCSHINIHKGGSNPRSWDKTWSEGCLTIPDLQWPDFQPRVYAEMDFYKQKVIDVVLVENRLAANGRQALFDDKGRPI